MRACAGAGSKSGLRPCLHWVSQNLHRSCRGNGSSYPGGAPPLAPRYRRVLLDDVSRYRQNHFSVLTRKRSCGFAGASTLNRNLPFTHFTLAASLAHLGQLDEARALPALDLRSNRALRSAGSASTHRATIRPTLLGASASMRVCAWPGCLRGDVGVGHSRRFGPAPMTFRFFLETDVVRSSEHV